MNEPDVPVAVPVAEVFPVVLVEVVFEVLDVVEVVVLLELLCT